MAITTAMANSFKQELFEAGHDFQLSGGSTFDIILIKDGMTGTYGAASTNYTDITGNTDEVTGTGYTAGGETLTRIDPSLDGSTAITDFGDVQWASASFTSRGCMIKNTTLSGAACSVHDFGEAKTASGGNFDLAMPAAAAATAVLRLA